ncbi:MAG: FtsW/RodA/SpoVE family cell cycle protein, partial [Propionicimonas sp.]
DNGQDNGPGHGHSPDHGGRPQRLTVGDRLPDPHDPEHRLRGVLMSEIVVYRKRRGVEAFMMVLALAISLGGYVLIHLNTDAELPPQWPWAVGIAVGLALLIHLVVRWRLPYADPLILPSVLLLNGLGLALIHRLDQADTKAPHSAELQLMWTAAAIVAACVVIFLLRDYRILRAYPYLLFLIGMVTLMLPLVPGLGQESHGAQIWIRLGRWSFQPAEVAKIILSIAFAAYLVEKREVLALAGARFAGIDLPRLRDLGPILVMWLASLAVLVFQKDLGTSLLFFGLFVMMLYVATERPSWPILGLLLFSAGAYLAFLAFGHVQVRVSSWLDPFSKFDQNYQVINAQFGLAWGGFFGTGWGLGRPYLTPLAKTDFIAAAAGEEIGVAGLTAIICVYGLIVARGLRTALGAKDPFGKLLAAGLSFVFALQVFAILGGVTRLLPLTGLTTPFMSQGGSSLVANWVMIALLLVITHHVRRPVLDTGAAGPVHSLAEESTQIIDLTAGPPAPVVTGATLPTPPGPAEDVTQVVIRRDA